MKDSPRATTSAAELPHSACVGRRCSKGCEVYDPNLDVFIRIEAVAYGDNGAEIMAGRVLNGEHAQCVFEGGVAMACRVIEA